MAYSFNGSSQYLTTSTGLAITGGAMSFSFWFKGSWSAATRYFWGASYSGNERLYLSTGGSTNNAGFSMQDNGGSDISWNGFDASPLYDGSWHNVVLRIASNAVSQVTVDNSAISGMGGFVFSFTDYTLTTNKLMIMARNAAGTPTGYKSGDFAEFAIWNSTLSGANVTALWNGGAGAVASGVASGSLIHYWPLNGDFNDAKGSNHASAVGSPSASAHPFGGGGGGNRRRRSLCGVAA